MRIKFFFLTFLAFSAVLSANAREFCHFSEIEASQSIFSTVNSLCPQKGSFVWVGTDDGLFRISSGNCRKFDIGKVGKVFEDANGRLWVVSGGCLYNYDSEKKDFSLLMEDVLSGCSCPDACFFAGSGSLYKVDYGKRSAIHSVGDLDIRVADMCCWYDNAIAMRTSDGKISVIDRTTGLKLPFECASTGFVSAIFADSHERLWVSVAGEGVFCYDRRGTCIESYSKSGGLATNLVNSFAEYYGSIWLGHDAFGIDVINPVTSVIEHLSSMNMGSITSLASSREDVVWIGLRKGGILQAVSSPVCSIPLEYKDGITCAVEDGSQALVYLGTEGSGLLACNPVNLSVTPAPGMSGVPVMSAARLSQSEIIVYSKGSGVSVYNKVSSSLTPFRPTDIELMSICSRPGCDLHLDNDEEGNVCISSDSALFVYDPESGKSRRIGLPEGFCPDGLLSPVPGRFKGKYYFNNGRVFSVSGDGSSLVQLYEAGAGIHSASMSSDNVLWMATDSGLLYYNIWTSESGCASTDVFPSATVVLCDDTNHVWCGTPGRIFQYDPDTRCFTQFDAADGVTDVNFYGGARCANGRFILLSGLQNLYVVESGISTTHSVDPVLGLVDLKVEGQSVNATVSQQGSNLMRSAEYRFRLTKAKRETIYENGSSNTLTVSNLMPGRYRLAVSCTNRNCNWTEWKEVDEFRIDYPYYFWALIVLCLLLAALATYPLLFRRHDAVPEEENNDAEIPVAPSPAPVPGYSSIQDKPDTSRTETATPPAVRSSFFMPPLPYESTTPPVRDISDAVLLVVEDDIDLRGYLESEFSSYFKKIYLAGDGAEAVNILNYEDVDIVVSDVMMPRMDGFELCRFIKTHVHLSHIPVILLTARSDADSRMLGYKNGADDYMTKPFDLVVLMNSISNLFLGRELSRQRYSSDGQIPSSEETTFSSADEEFMRNFTELVSSHISDPDLDVRLLVEQTGISRSLLFSKVKNLTGMNLQSFVNKMRMEKVIDLMTTTGKSFAEIAQECGFSSPRYFSTAFKNYTGMTPSQYRKEH